MISKIVSLFLFLSSCLSEASVPSLKEIKQINVCGTKFLAEIARSDEDRSKGLMGRVEILPTKAMVFIFESDQPLSFWMKNVPFDVDIGFFDSKGSFVSYETMKGTSPLQMDSKLPSYKSLGPAKYAIEVHAGFFKKVKNLKKCTFAPLL